MFKFVEKICVVPDLSEVWSMYCGDMVSDVWFDTYIYIAGLEPTPKSRILNCSLTSLRRNHMRRDKASFTVFRSSWS
jgi:hypothetical protein